MWLIFPSLCHCPSWCIFFFSSSSTIHMQRQSLPEALTVRGSVCDLCTSLLQIWSHQTIKTRMQLALWTLKSQFARFSLTISTFFTVYQHELHFQTCKFLSKVLLNSVLAVGVVPVMSWLSGPVCQLYCPLNQRRHTTWVCPLCGFTRRNLHATLKNWKVAFCSGSRTKGRNSAAKVESKCVLHSVHVPLTHKCGK